METVIVRGIKVHIYWTGQVKVFSYDVRLIEAIQKYLYDEGFMIDGFVTA